MLCSEASLVNHGIGKVRAVTLRCRAWTCDLCLPWRRGRLTGLAKDGKPNSFITLTVNPASGVDVEARARALVEAWRVVVRRAKARYGYKSIPYLAVFEATKNGEPHLHILARVKWLDQKWLSAQMGELIGAPVVDIRRVHSDRHVALYVAKYIGKGPGKFGTCKRYWHTRDWVVEPKPKPKLDLTWDSVWCIVEKNVGALALEWWGQGYDIQHDHDMGYREGRKPP